MLYRFGDLELDSLRRELHRNGTPIRVEPKVLDLILLLIENRGRVVDRDEITGWLWPDMNVQEGALTTCIHRARLLLGGDPRTTPIRTRRQRGYEFVGSIECAPDGDDGAGSASRTLIGRDVESGRASALLDTVATGGRAVLLVTGEPGIGKTSLLAAIMRNARRRGFRTWWVEADARPGRGAFGMWLDLLRDNVTEDDWKRLRQSGDRGAQHEAALAQWLRDARAAGGDRLLAPWPVTEPPGGRRALHHAVAGLLRAVAATPVAIAIDEAHAADRDSLQLLGAMCRERGPGAVLFAAALRHPEPGSAVTRPLHDLIAAPDAVRIQLHPLSGEAVATLLAARAGGPLDRSCSRGLPPRSAATRCSCSRRGVISRAAVPSNGRASAGRESARRSGCGFRERCCTRSASGWRNTRRRRCGFSAQPR